MAAAAGDQFEDDGEEIELQDPKVWPQVGKYMYHIICKY